MSSKRTECVIYARVSSKEQEEKGYSIQEQIRLLRDYAQKHNFNIVKEYTDVETAFGKKKYQKKIKKVRREQFYEMVDFLQNDRPEIRILLVEKTDRLYRNFRDYVTLEDLDLEIHLVTEGGIMSEDSCSQAKFIHGIKVLMAKNFIDNLSEEVRKGMRGKVEDGIYPSRAPIGYKNVTDGKEKRIEIDPEKEELVRKLFEWYATGRYSLKQLCDRAYRIGIGYRKNGRKFSAGTMEKILKNPLYYGWIRWRDIFKKGIHKPIITEELFHQVQAHLHRFDKAKNIKHNFAFRGLLTCGYCGCKMTAQRIKGKYIYYNCTGAKGKCPQKYHKEEQVALKLGDAVKAITIDPEIVEWIVSALKDSNDDERKFHKKMINDMQRELAKLESRLDKVYVDKLDEKISEERWESYREKYSAEIERIKKRMDRCLNANIDYYEQGSKILSLAESAYTQYLTKTNEEKRELLNFILLNCTVKGDEYSFEFRQPFDIIAVHNEKIAKQKGEFGENPPIHQLWRTKKDLNS